MAKQPETQDRYRIQADNIPLEGLGPVLAALVRLGIINVTYELVTDILAYKAAPRVFDVEAIDAARTFIKQHHTFKARELTRVFEQEGRSAANGFSVMKRLVELGELRKLGGGHYQSTDIKALAPPAAEAEPESAPAARNSKAGVAPKRYPVSSIIVVMNAIAKRKQVTRAEITEIMLENGRPKKSVDGVIGKLKEGGKLKNISEGLYEVNKTKPEKAMKHA
jgi:hypothetical protein